MRLQLFACYFPRDYLEARGEHLAKSRLKKRDPENELQRNIFLIFFGKCLRVEEHMSCTIHVPAKYIFVAGVCESHILLSVFVYNFDTI